MNKLIADHEIGYMTGRIPTSPEGVAYGFTARSMSIELLIMTKKDVDCKICPPHARGDWKYWKFDPEPCSTIEALAYDIINGADSKARDWIHPGEYV